MSNFLTSLKVEKIDGGRGGKGTWELLAPLIYDSDVAGRVFVVPTGFISDFASVPRIPLAFLLTAESACKAAVVHDFLYCRQDITRTLADAVFREAMGVSGEPGWRSWLMWAGVRMGGWIAWDNHQR